MKKFLLAFGLLLLAQMGCNKQLCGCIMFEMAVPISYVNAAGTDLLDSAKTGGIKKDDIDLYYLENGVKTKVYNPSRNSPENFYIAQGSDGKYFLSVGASEHTDGNSISTTYISIKNYPEDTLTTEISRKNGMQVTKAWLNGELKLSGYMNRITVVR